MHAGKNHFRFLCSGKHRIGLRDGYSQRLFAHHVQPSLHRSNGEFRMLPMRRGDDNGVYHPAGEKFLRRIEPFSAQLFGDGP